MAANSTDSAAEALRLKREIESLTEKAQRARGVIDSLTRTAGGPAETAKLLKELTEVTVPAAEAEYEKLLGEYEAAYGQKFDPPAG